MYSESIRSKVDAMFCELKTKTATIVDESLKSSDAVNRVTKLVSSELSARSKSILSDMLFDLTDSLMDTEFFSDVARQNRFTEINLRQEILSKYQFGPIETIDYKEASRTLRALEVGGATLVVGGAIEIGVVLMSGLSFSSLVPIPVGLLIVASIGTAMADYYAIEPTRSKRAMIKAFDDYLDQSQQQFLNWFDEVERYFDKRVEEIKKTL